MYISIYVCITLTQFVHSGRNECTHLSNQSSNLLVALKKLLVFVFVVLSYLC